MADAVAAVVESDQPSERTPTRFEWSFVDSGDGTIFQRFKRQLPFELWLLGLERPLDPERAAGKYIIEPDGAHREVKRVLWPFTVDPEEVPLVHDLIAVSGFRKGAFPSELVEAILHHCDLPRELFEQHLSQGDVERIAEAVAERIAADG